MRNKLPSQSGFNLMFFMVFISIIVFWSVMGFFSFKLYGSVSEIGLKKTWEIIWEGPGNSTIKGENK